MLLNIDNVYFCKFSQYRMNHNHKYNDIIAVTNYIEYVNSQLSC